MPEDLNLRPREVLRPLFEKAQLTDEFEFACTLLRILAMEDAFWDPFEETYKVTRQLTGLINAPIDEQLRLRLLLFLYCHVTEADDFFNVVANLLRITAGERYSSIPFDALPRQSRKRPQGHRLNTRTEKLVTLARAQDFPLVGDLFETLFLRPVRNAFYHSDYILSPDSFNIRQGEGLDVLGQIEMRIPYDWLMPRLHFGINAGIVVMELLLEFMQSYKSDKVVRGRFESDGSYIDIQLTTDSNRGLTGFKSPPDSGLVAAPSNPTV